MGGTQIIRRFGSLLVFWVGRLRLDEGGCAEQLSAPTTDTPDRWPKRARGETVATGMMEVKSRQMMMVHYSLVVG